MSLFYETRQIDRWKSGPPRGISWSVAWEVRKLDGDKTCRLDGSGTPGGKGADDWWMLVDLLCETNFLIDKKGVCLVVKWFFDRVVIDKLEIS